MSAQKVLAEVTGTVWQIVARVGDDLNPEDPIIIVESMKMEIPVVAPKAGRLVALLVGENDPVSEGQVVAHME